MLDKDTSFFDNFRHFLPYLSTLVLSAWGGAVAHLSKLRKSKSVFNWRELSFDLITSTFAGLITYLFCLYAAIDGALSAVLIAVSGHMGTRAIASFENLYNRIIGVNQNGANN